MKSSEFVNALRPIAQLFIANDDYPAERARDVVAAVATTLEHDEAADPWVVTMDVVMQRMQHFGLKLRHGDALVDVTAKSAKAWLEERGSNNRPMERAGRAPKEEQQHGEDESMGTRRALDARGSHGGSR